MKRIIRGRRYDTETSIDVLSLAIPFVFCTDGVPDSWDDQELYVTQKGQWFLANNAPEGGIHPISIPEVIEILEEHEQTDLIEKYFSDRIEDA